jgi:hypothetical protein
MSNHLYKTECNTELYAYKPLTEKYLTVLKIRSGTHRFPDHLSAQQMK